MAAIQWPSNGSHWLTSHPKHTCTTGYSAFDPAKGLMNGFNSRSLEKTKHIRKVDDAERGSEDGCSCENSSSVSIPQSCPLCHPAAFWRAGATLRTEAKSNPSWRLIGGAAAPTLAAGGREEMFSCLFFRQREKPSKVDCDNTDGLEVQVLFCSGQGISPSHPCPETEAPVDSWVDTRGQRNNISRWEM